jgi:pre-mRNA-processing factor 17
VFHNPRLEDLHAPVAGPAHPYRADGLAAGQRNHPTGFVEVRARACTPPAACTDAQPSTSQDAHVGSFVFDEQYNTFHSFGYGVEPSGHGFVGDADAMQRHKGAFELRSL